MLIIFLLLFIIFVNIIINILINQKCRLLKKKLFEYEKIIDEYGKKNHEYNNQLMILKGLLNNKKKLSEYLDTIIDDHRTGQNYEVRQLSKFPNNGFKEMLYIKFSKMEELNIKNYLYISNDIKNSIDKIDIILFKDITKIFGVFIDNAIDASKEAETKEIEIDFKNDKKYLTIIIKNTFKNNNAIKKIGKKRFTTKGQGHGFGLYIVKEIVKNNNKIEIVTEQDNPFFIQTIIVEL